MTISRASNGLCLFLASVAPLAITAPAYAQAEGDASQDSAAQQASSEETQNDGLIVVTGNRFGGRIITDSPTPIDSISAEQLTKGGGNDLQGMIKVTVPSFSTPRPSAGGVTDFLQSPTMRGLSTGQLLVLINGKRRHTNSELNNNQQIGRGDVAYDFGAIPASAIKNVEVLRDGAAAQYGSDAIGGVMNLILDDRVGYQASGKVGTTTHGDGEHYEINGAAGFPLGDGGSIRFTAQYIDHRHTDRAEPDTRQQYFGTNAAGQLVNISGNFGSGIGLTPSSGALDPREATFNRDIWVFGEPDYKNHVIFGNMELPVFEGFELYAFGGYNKLRGISYNFFRRAGQNETVRGIHPDGFLPLNRLILKNYSGAGGIRGDLGDFAVDLSSTYGKSYSSQANLEANNVSLGLASPLDSLRYSTQFQQWTNNLDISREIPMGDASPLQIAFGAEYRKEWYDLGPGDESGYIDGGVPILDGPNAGQKAPIGFQPTPGIDPASAISGSRNAKALYAEIQKEFFGRLLLDGAVRYEHYSDFGSTTNFKVAGKFDLTDSLAVRGSYGTGFRAPALAQIFFHSSVSTFLNGQPVAIQLVSVADPIADLVGAPDLEPEKAKNLSLGAVFSIPGFSISADYYRIKLENRLALSGTFQGTALINYLTANGFPGVSAVSFVTNGVDTTTQGVDVTASWRTDLSPRDKLTFTLAANYNKSEIDRVDGTPAPLAAIGLTTPLQDLTQQVRLTRSTPKSKIAMDVNWRHDQFFTNLTVSRYGEVSQVALTDRTQTQVDALLLPGYNVTLVPANAAGTRFDIIQHFSADVVADLELGYEFSNGLTLSAGASNIFDKFPDRQIASTVESVAAGTNGADNNGIFPYAYIAPYGTSGRFVYLKAKFSL